MEEDDLQQKIITGSKNTRGNRWRKKKKQYNNKKKKEKNDDLQ